MTVELDTVRVVILSILVLWVGGRVTLLFGALQRFSIPMRAEAETSPDGATVIHRLTWTDPGNLVHAVSLSTIDRDTGELVEAFFREGKAEFVRYEVTLAEIESSVNWKIEFEHDGTDGNRPARIRIATQRDGDLLTSSKLVRFLDDDSSEYFERNGSELRLVEVAEQ